MTRHQKRRRLANWLNSLLGLNLKKAKPARVIRAEPLEKRELMAADTFLALLGSAQRVDSSGLMAAPLVSSDNGDSRLSGEGEDRLVGEGEPANDLVAFAKALAATTTKSMELTGAHSATSRKLFLKMVLNIFHSLR